MSARTDLSGGYQADWYPYRDSPTAGAPELYPNPVYGSASESTPRGNGEPQVGGTKRHGARPRPYKRCNRDAAVFVMRGRQHEQER
jgi:hypothetical protein